MLPSYEAAAQRPKYVAKDLRSSRRDSFGSNRLGAQVSLFVAVLYFLGSFAGAQTEPEHPWIGREASLEKILLEGEVLKKEAIGHGVTRPVRLLLEHEGQKIRAVWKPIHPLRHGEMESYQAEIAAYRLSRALGLDMVPPTVERRIGRNFGSVQLWIEQVVPYTDLRNTQSAESRWPLQFARMQFFDHLIDNPDRNSGNFLIDRESGRLYLIDHSRALNFAGRGRNREKGAPPISRSVPGGSSPGSDAGGTGGDSWGRPEARSDSGS